MLKISVVAFFYRQQLMAGSAITELGTLVSLGITEYQNSRGQVAVLKITAKMDEISIKGREA